MENQMEECQAMMADPDMKELAEAEYYELKDEKEKVINTLNKWTITNPLEIDE